VIFGLLKSYQYWQQDWVALRSNRSNSVHEPQFLNPCIFQYTLNWKKWRSYSCSWACFLQISVFIFHFSWSFSWTSLVVLTGEDNQS
jgi:hypothetical protein